MSVLLAPFPSQTPDRSGVPSANIGAGPVGAGGCFRYRPTPPRPEAGGCPRPGACASSETAPATATAALKPIIHALITRKTLRPEILSQPPDIRNGDRSASTAGLCPLPGIRRRREDKKRIVQWRIEIQTPVLCRTKAVCTTSCIWTPGLAGSDNSAARLSITRQSCDCPSISIEKGFRTATRGGGAAHTLISAIWHQAQADCRLME